MCPKANSTEQFFTPFLAPTFTETFQSTQVTLFLVVHFLIRHSFSFIFNAVFKDFSSAETYFSLSLRSYTCQQKYQASFATSCPCNFPPLASFVCCNSVIYKTKTERNATGVKHTFSRYTWCFREAMTFNST